MAARLQLSLAAVLAIVAAGLGAVLLLGDGKGSANGAFEVGPTGFAGFVRPDIPPKDFRLTDQDGAPVDLASDRGKVVVLTFMYSRCQDTCPITASQIRGALDQLGRDVPVLAVSVDPANDTQDSARRFLVRQHVAGRMRFLLGSRSQLAPVWGAYGIQPQGKGTGRAFDHSAYVLLVDKRGRQRVSFPVAQLTPEALAHDLRRLLAERA
jgi:protein SCO1/2